MELFLFSFCCCPCCQVCFLINSSATLSLHQLFSLIYRVCTSRCISQEFSKFDAVDPFRWNCPPPPYTEITDTSRVICWASFFYIFVKSTLLAKPCTVFAITGSCLHCSHRHFMDVYSWWILEIIVSPGSVNHTKSKNIQSLFFQSYNPEKECKFWCKQ